MSPEHLTNLFCKKRGIKAEDLARHKQIDDVMLLLHINEEFRPEFNLSEQASWGAIWDWTYHKKFPLKAKHKIKLELICIQALNRRKDKLKKIEKIKQLRQTV
ncbi:hypothetical protein UFOVP641_24 [uncultured Caudovirales phage]|uniref:Uncharacterized protein n=1 Tax=uncultured Caudovirales phage TaxID=2100421 RepID=A0A6J5N3V8_9CAUD|nr:hypothetical protein UFOVP641_24 [uncultured Caudovirales phage]